MASAYFKNGSVIESFTSTATAAGTLTLTATSDAYQIFTGSTTHTMVMPAATTLIANQKFEVLNSSTGSITVNANGGGNLGTVAAGQSMVFHVTDISTSAGTWDVSTVASGGAAGLSTTESTQFQALSASGFSAQSKVLKIRPEEVAGNYWTTMAPTITARANTAGESLNGFGYIIGGLDSANTTVLSDNHRYNDDSNFWLAKTGSTSARMSATAFIQNSVIYYVGGSSTTAFTGGTATNQQYTDSTDTWATKTSMSVSRSMVGKIVLTKAFIAGGLNTSNTATSDNYTYDATLDAWYLRNALPSNYGASASFTLNNVGWIVAGTSDNGTTVLNTSQKYREDTNFWTAGPNVSVARYLIGGGNSFNGLGYASAGANSSGTSVATNEEYSDAGSNWNTKNALTNARHYVGFLVLNGQGYAVGGRNNPASTNGNFVEIYKNTSFFNLGSLNRSTTTPTSIAAAVNLNALTPNVQVQLRTDGNNWKNFTSAGSALKLNEIINTKFISTPLPYVSGGSTNGTGSGSLTSNDFYNANSDAWVNRQTLPAARLEQSGYMIDGIGYTLAGRNSSDVNQSDQQSYNEITNAFTSKAAAPSAFHDACGNSIGGFGFYYVASQNANDTTKRMSRYNSTLDSFTNKTAPSQSVSALTMFNTAGRLWIYGGSASGTDTNANTFYDDSLDSWTSKATSFNRSTYAGFSLNGKFYVCGGFQTSQTNAVETYNPGSDSWVHSGSGTGDLPTSIAHNNGFVSDGYGYSIGGYTGSYTAQFHQFNPFSLVWTSKTSQGVRVFTSRGYIPGPYRNYELRVAIPAFFAGIGGGVWSLGTNISTNHNSGGEFSLGGYGYAVNGFIGTGAQTAQMDRYNETVDAWTQSVSNSNALYSVPTFVLEGRGHRPTGQTSNGPHEAFSPELNAWATLASGPGVADYAQGSTLDGRGWVLGASGASTAQYYKNSTNAWTTVTGPGSGFQSARWSQNGFIYAAGSDAVSTTTQRYNDVSDSWASVGSMIVARRNHAVLFAGKGLMAGSVTSLVTSAEQYNDASNIWTLTASLSTGVGSQAVFSLQNAYSAGGYNGAAVNVTQRFSNSVKNAVLSAGLTVS